MQQAKEAAEPEVDAKAQLNKARQHGTEMGRTRALVASRLFGSEHVFDKRGQDFNALAPREACDIHLLYGENCDSSILLTL